MGLNTPHVTSGLLVFGLLVAVSTLFGGSTAYKAVSDLGGGAYSPVFQVIEMILDEKDPQIIQLGRFAVDEYNRENSKANLSFSSLTGVKYSNATLPEMNYWLSIEITNGTTYDAGLLVHNHGDKKLAYFWVHDWSNDVA